MYMPGQSTGLQHLVSVSGNRQQQLPKMGFPNDVFSNKSNMFQPCVLASQTLYIAESIRKRAVLVPKTPTGPSVSHFLQPWDMAGIAALREEMTWGRLCLPKELGTAPRRLWLFGGVQWCCWGPNALKIQFGRFFHAMHLSCSKNHHHRQGTEW